MSEFRIQSWIYTDDEDEARFIMRCLRLLHSNDGRSGGSIEEVIRDGDLTTVRKVSDAA